MIKMRFETKRGQPFFRTRPLPVLMGVLLILLIGGPIAFSQAEESGSEAYSPLLYSEACFREPSDQQWSLNITGKVHSGSGCFLIIHNADRVIATFTVPQGTYPADNPLVLTIPADGVAGDYRMIILGEQQDVMGINLPLSTLKEMYGYRYFAKNGKKILWFLAPENAAEFELVGFGGKVRLLDANGTSVGETALVPNSNSKNELLKLALTPGKIYGIEQNNVFYIDVKPGAYLTFDREQLFLPDPKLRDFKWWLDPGLTKHQDIIITAPTKGI